MTLPAIVLANMRDTVTIRLATAGNAYNEITLGNPITVRGRVSYARTTVSTTQGDQRFESTVLYLPDVSGLTTDAQITLPDGTTRSPQSVRRLAWPDGQTWHLQVVL